jgi:hypothetical protein
MSNKTLPKLEEAEIIDGPHAGFILRVLPGTLDFSVHYATIDRLGAGHVRYVRQFDRTAEGRIAFKMTLSFRY